MSDQISWLDMVSLLVLLVLETVITGITLQSMQSLVSRFGVTSEVEGLNGDNSAVTITWTYLPSQSPGKLLM